METIPPDQSNYSSDEDSSDGFATPPEDVMLLKREHPPLTQSMPPHPFVIPDDKDHQPLDIEGVDLVNRVTSSEEGGETKGVTMDTSDHVTTNKEIQSEEESLQYLANSIAHNYQLMTTVDVSCGQEGEGLRISAANCPVNINEAEHGHTTIYNDTSTGPDNTSSDNNRSSKEVDQEISPIEQDRYLAQALLHSYQLMMSYDRACDSESHGYQSMFSSGIDNNQTATTGTKCVGDSNDGLYHPVGVEDYTDTGTQPAEDTTRSTGNTDTLPTEDIETPPTEDVKTPPTEDIDTPSIEHISPVEDLETPPTVDPYLIVAAPDQDDAAESKPMMCDSGSNTDITPTYTVGTEATPTCTDIGVSTEVTPSADIAVNTEVTPSTDIAVSTEVALTSVGTDATPTCTDIGISTEATPTFDIAVSTEVTPTSDIAISTEATPTCSIGVEASTTCTDVGITTEATPTFDIAVGTGITPIFINTIVSSETTPTSDTAVSTEVTPTSDVAISTETTPTSDVAVSTDPVLISNVAMPSYTVAMPTFTDAAISTEVTPTSNVAVSTEATPTLDIAVGTEATPLSDTCINTDSVDMKDCETETVVVEYKDVDTNTELNVFEILKQVHSQEKFLQMEEHLKLKNIELNEERSNRMVNDNLVAILQKDIISLQQRNVEESTNRIRLDGEIAELKAELQHSRKEISEKDERINELDESLSGTLLLVRKLEEQSAVMTNKGGVDYLLQAKIADGRAHEAEQRLEVLQAELLQSQAEVKRLLDRLGDLSRERREMVSNQVHNQLLQISDERAEMAERRVKELEREIVHLKSTRTQPSLPPSYSSPAHSSLYGLRPQSSFQSSYESTFAGLDYKSDHRLYGDSGYHGYGGAPPIGSISSEPTMGQHTTMNTYGSAPNRYEGLSSNPTAPTGAIGLGYKVLPTTLSSNPLSSTRVKEDSPILSEDVTSVGLPPVPSTTTTSNDMMLVDLPSVITSPSAERTQTLVKMDDKKINSDNDSSDWTSSDESDDGGKDDIDGEGAGGPLFRPTPHMNLQSKWEWLSQQQQNSSSAPPTAIPSSGKPRPPPIAPKPKFLMKQKSLTGNTSEAPITFDQPPMKPSLHSYRRTSGPKGRRRPSKTNLQLFSS